MRIDPNKDLAQGNTVCLFLKFTIPAAAGMLAISSANVVDGIFIGNQVGLQALAAVSLTSPLMATIYGILIMLTVGAAVFAGEHIGAGQIAEANNVFSKTFWSVLLLLSALAALILLFPSQTTMALGAKGDVIAQSAEYVWTIGLFFPVLSMVVLLIQFIRVDGQPNITFFGMAVISIGNVILDYIFIVVMQQGLTGAALATGLAHVAGGLVMLSYFLNPKSRLKLIRPSGSWMIIPRAAFNGFSEFLNETSSGLILFIFNWILMISVGIQGVTAFTIVNYMLFLGILVFYGASEGVIPLISVNFGARKARRIGQILLLAIALNLIIGLMIALTLLIWSKELVTAFIDTEKTEVIKLAMSITNMIWPAFLFNGTCIAISAYFTGVQCARQSAIIAFSRSLLLPVALIFLFWHILGYKGMFLALPCAEIITFALTLFLFSRNRPQKVIDRMA